MNDCSALAIRRHVRRSAVRPLAVVSVLLIVSTSPGLASDDEALAKAAQNPIANLISLPLQNNTSFDLGPLEGTQNVLNVQPVWPFSLGEDWNLITRTIVPVVSQPAFTPEQDRVNGIGDTSFTAFASPKAATKWTWGVGPVALLPTATDDRLGSDQWGLGPSIVALTMPGNWVVGALVSNIWSVGGGSDDDEINLLTLQYFVNYNIPNSGGWYLTSAPINTANWEAESGNQWTVPLGGGAGRVFAIGQQPVNVSAQAYYNVEAPDFGSEWQLRLQLQLLFPK